MLKVLTIDDLHWNAKVICIEGDYSGLIGYVDTILSGDERETENDTEYEIWVNFEEVENMDKLYSDLNGTSVEYVCMDIEELALVKEDGTTAIDSLGTIHTISNLIRK